MEEEEAGAVERLAPHAKLASHFAFGLPGPLESAPRPPIHAVIDLASEDDGEDDDDGVSAEVGGRVGEGGGDGAGGEAPPVVDLEDIPPSVVRVPGPAGVVGGAVEKMGRPEAPSQSSRGVHHCGLCGQAFVQRSSLRRHLGKRRCAVLKKQKATKAKTVQDDVAGGDVGAVGEEVASRVVAPGGGDPPSRPPPASAAGEAGPAGGAGSVAAQAVSATVPKSPKKRKNKRKGPSKARVGGPRRETGGVKPSRAYVPMEQLVAMAVASRHNLSHRNALLEAAEGLVDLSPGPESNEADSGVETAAEVSSSGEGSVGVEPRPEALNLRESLSLPPPEESPSAEEAVESGIGENLVGSVPGPGDPDCDVPLNPAPAPGPEVPVDGAGGGGGVVSSSGEGSVGVEPRPEDLNLRESRSLTPPEGSPSAEEAVESGIGENLVGPVPGPGDLGCDAPLNPAPAPGPEVPVDGAGGGGGVVVPGVLPEEVVPEVATETVSAAPVVPPAVPTSEVAVAPSKAAEGEEEPSESAAASGASIYFACQYDADRSDQSVGGGRGSLPRSRASFSGVSGPPSVSPLVPSRVRSSSEGGAPRTSTPLIRRRDDEEKDPLLSGDEGQPLDFSWDGVSDETFSEVSEGLDFFGAGGGGGEVAAKIDLEEELRPSRCVGFCRGPDGAGGQQIPCQDYLRVSEQVS